MKLNVFTVTKLLLKPDLWKSDVFCSFQDMLILKDGSLRVYSYETVSFRDGSGWKELYKVPLFVWPIMLLLGWRLNRLVKQRESLGINK